MNIYCVRYQFLQQSTRECFAKEQEARTRYAALRLTPDVTELELDRDKIMRPSAETILRILNGESYVLKRDKLIAADSKNENAA